MAALGPNVSDGDLTEFLRSAKLASRTKHDAELVATLDEAVALVRDADKDDFFAARLRQEERKLNSTYSERQNCDYESGVEAGLGFNEAGQQLDNINRKIAKRRSNAAQDYEDDGARKKQQAATLIQKLQAELDQAHPKS